MKIKISNGSSELIIYIVLILITWAVYWQVYDSEFLNLDDIYITENPYIRSGITKDNIIRVFTSLQAGYWLPVTCISHMLDFHLYGNYSGGHHLTNVFFHLMNVLLLFSIFKRITNSLWQSAFVAALFAIHPLHVESVAWVVERKDVLSTFFWLLTMRVYFLYTDSPSIKRYLWMLLLFILGLMSKPMLVTLPFVLLLIDFWPLSRFDFSTSPIAYLRHKATMIFTPKNQPFYNGNFTHQGNGSIFLEKAPLLIIAVIFSIITIRAQQEFGAVNSFDSLSLQARIDNAVVAYVVYLGKLVWPLHLAVLYPHPITLPWWKVYGAIAILATISFSSIHLMRQHPYFFVGWFWYMGVLLPVSGIMQSGVQAMADRFVYIPLIGVYIIIAWGAPALLSKRRYKKEVLLIGAIVILIAFFLTTWFQIQRWRNNISLFEHTLEITSGNYLIHNHLGAALRDLGQADKAISHFKEAIRINPQYAEAYNNLGASLAEQGRTDDAIRYYYKSLKIDPEVAYVHYNLALALTREGKKNEAIKHYLEVLRIDAENAQAHNNIGVILAGQNRLSEAASHFAEAIRINPQYGQAHHNIALVMHRKGEKKRAEYHFRRSLQIQQKR